MVRPALPNLFLRSSSSDIDRIVLASSDGFSGSTVIPHFVEFIIFAASPVPEYITGTSQLREGPGADGGWLLSPCRNFLQRWNF